MIGLLKDIFGGIITVLKSKYKLIFILFALWIYRIDFIPEDGSGIGKVRIYSLFLTNKRLSKFGHYCGYTVLL